MDLKNPCKLIRDADFFIWNVYFNHIGQSNESKKILKCIISDNPIMLLAIKK
jgi:hypothetical protein